ncbi:DUF805 domain-containing protein [Pseudomonas aeruginosa]
MALADGVDLVYLSQGLALLPLGTGLVGLLAGFLLHVRGRWLGALLALLPATLICAWNLYNYAAHGGEALSPSFAQYTQALLGLLLPALGVTARRLHDINKSGWWMLIALIPIVGLYLIYLLAKDSDAGQNQYGQNPKGIA